MTTYASLTAQISQLQKKAEEVRLKEVSGVVARIREAIDTYGLTAADLGLLATGKASKGLKAGAKLGAKAATRQFKVVGDATKRPTVGVPRYQDPKSGKTWTGHGKPPLWISGAKNRDAFLIDKPGVTAATASAAPANGSGVSVSAKQVSTAAIGKAKASAKFAPAKGAKVTNAVKTKAGKGTKVGKTSTKPSTESQPESEASVTPA